MEIHKRIFAAKGIIEKKEILKELSLQAKDIIKMNPDKFLKVNDVLIEVFYKDDKHKEFKLFKEWKKEGYKIKSGSKAFFVWSQPIKGSSKKEKDQEQDTESNEFKFFSIAHLFSNEQVEHEENKKNGPDLEISEVEEKHVDEIIVNELTNQVSMF